jgi:hypothetical protein
MGDNIASETLSRKGKYGSSNNYAIGYVVFNIRKGDEPMKRQRWLSAIAVGLTSTMILGGCSVSSQSPSSPTNANSANTATTKNNLVANASETTNPNLQTNPLFNMSLTLPNGQTLTPTNPGLPVRWKDLEITLVIPDLPSHSPKYLEIVGNHSTVLSHTTISTSAGTATLVLNERTPPAADQSSVPPTYEYWLIVYGSPYAYAIDATIVGNRNNAKSEVMELVNNWKVPR